MRRVIAGSAALAIGLIAWTLHRESAGLVAPPACPGLLDAGAAWISRLVPRLALGDFFVRANALLLVPAVALVVAAVRRLSGSWLAAYAAGLALAGQQILSPAMSPFDPVVPIVTAAGLLFAAGRSSLALSLARRPFAVSAVVGAAMLSFRWLVPSLPQAASQTVFTCAVPLTVSAWAAWLSGLLGAIGSAGPYAVALAAVGVYVLLIGTSRGDGPPLRRVAWVLIVCALVPALGADPGQPVLREYGSLIVAFWICAGLGLRDVMQSCRPSVRGRLAATTVTVLLPVFQFTGFRAPIPAPETFGLDRLTGEDVHQLLSVLPDKAAIVQEDAVFAALLRGLSGSSQRMGKQIVLASSAPEELAALSAGQLRLFALPSAQSGLPWLGFRLRDADLVGVSGVAEVSTGGDCQRIRRTWMAAGPLPPQARAISVVTRGPGSEHAVLAYLVTRTRPDVSVIEPAHVERVGFHHDFYDMTLDRDRVRVLELIGEDGVPPELLAAAPFVTRMEFWRSPTTPATIGVDISGRPDRLLIRTTGTAGSDVVCPAFPYGPRTLQIK